MGKISILSRRTDYSNVITWLVNQLELIGKPQEHFPLARLLSPKYHLNGFPTLLSDLAGEMSIFGRYEFLLF